MNETEIVISLGQRAVGKLVVPVLQVPSASTSTNGFRLGFKSYLQVEWAKGQVRPVVRSLSAVVAGPDGREAGVAESSALCKGSLEARSWETELVMRGSLVTLGHLERLRNGQSMRLTMGVRGEVHALMEITNPSAPNGPKVLVQTEPWTFGGNAEIEIPVDKWVQILRRIGAIANVLVEIPLPASRPAPWDQIWKAVDEARDCLEQGGTNGWKGCATAVRQALSLWQKEEPEHHGSGWRPPSQTEREARTTPERIDNLRWDLLQAAHRAAHSLADEWSRDEAVLLLGTLAGLLAVRKP